MNTGKKDTIIASGACGLITAAGVGMCIQPLTTWLLRGYWPEETAMVDDLVNVSVILFFFLLGSSLPLAVHIARGGRRQAKFDPLFGLAALVLVISLLLYRFFLTAVFCRPLIAMGHSFMFLSRDLESTQIATYLAFLAIHTIGPVLVLAVMKNLHDRCRNRETDKMESNRLAGTDP